METKHEELYEAPTTDVLEVKNEGIICASGDVPASMNNPFYEEDI